MLHQLFSIMPIFVVLFWVIVLLLDERKNNSKRFLAFFLSISVVNYFVHWLYFNRQYSLYAVFDSVWVFTSLAGYPLYYYYIRLLTKDVRLNMRWFWLVMPAFVVAAFSTTLYLLMSPLETDIFIKGIMYHQEGYLPPYPLLVKMQMMRLILFKVVFAVQLIPVVYFGLKLIRNYNVEIRRFYSNLGGKDLLPIKWLLIFFVFASLVSLISSVLGKDYFVKNTALLAIPSITHSLYMFGIGYFGYKQNFTIEEFQKDDSQAGAGKESPNNSSAQELNPYEQIKTRLLELLENKEVFTNPDLRITDVSALLNTNRTYVSRIINEELKTNFSELINRQRVNYTKKMLIDCSADSYSLNQIAEMAGFSSSSSFYRIFKEKEGISPGDFRKEFCRGKGIAVSVKKI